MATGSLPIGSAVWVSEERAAALRLADNDVHEFSFAARRGFEWLNDHMAGIFNENEINFAETFKTPGKSRQQNNWAARKADTGEARVPLSDIFSGTPRGAPNPFLQQLNRLNSPTATNNGLRSPLAPAAQFSPKKTAPPPTRQAAPISFADSGYHGSQSQDTVAFSSPEETRNRLQSPSSGRHAPFLNATPTAHTRHSPTRTRILQSPTATFLTAKEEQTAKIIREASQRLTSPQLARTQNLTARIDAPSSPIRTLQSSPVRTSPIRSTPAKASSPLKAQPQSPIARKPVPSELEPQPEPEPEAEPQIPNSNEDDEGTHSDGSSPIRPMVRKSSLNFASLPAREPLNTGKSLGGRMSRTSNLDINRTSYYGRPTGGKSLGNTVAPPSDDDDVDMDDDDTVAPKPADAENVTTHNKTYTQRLQDQISMLGKSQPKPARPSKSIANLAPIQTTTPAPTRTMEASKALSPVRKPTTPGAFPEDDEDDWIQPQPTAQKPKAKSPRPVVPPKDDIVSTGTLNMDFVLPKQRQQTSRPASPQRRPIIPERTTSTVTHMKSASVSALPDSKLDDTAALKKTISVSNPALSSVPESERPQSPLRSPTRSIRDSPLKHVKNKLSSILKSSKGLLASSAAISAEGKSSILSPSTTRLDFHGGLSSDSLVQLPAAVESTYPDLTQALMDTQAISRPASPSKPSVRKTRASAERERKEKQMEKEARRLADQEGKLEKLREKEAEKARVFSKESERIAAMEKQVSAQKEQEKRRPAPKEAPKSARSSPRRKPQVQDGDVEMQEAPAAMQAPPSIPRPGSALRGKDIKRPMRPTKEAASRSRVAPPTVIKVNMGPHHSQYHPSNAALSANLGEALGPSAAQSQASGKAGQPTLKSKGSAQSLKSSVSSTGRPKALELAAKKKEQEEREAQRKRQAKAEIERKRAALQEDERRQEQQQQQQRRLEAERQREKEREAAEAKKAAQRQAAIERAKQTRAPPPAVRSQPNGPPDYASSSQEKAGMQPPRPGSRMGSAIGALKGQKRPLGQDSDVGNARTQAAVRNGPTYQGKDAKRRRTSQEPDDDTEMESLPNIKGPPVRPSAGFKKEMSSKQMYAAGYATAPQGTTRDLFKSTVTSQHNGTMKTGHGLDTAQFSKGTIPFAATAGQASFKTPARPGAAAAGAKSAAKSAPRTSPRFQNGDSIDLPEIQTDDDDEYSDDEDGGSGGGAAVASWADSPDLRRALLRQETMDPSQIFGPPAPLNMEEVFSKSKDRWHKFRARTSSANWSGGDRLTEEDIRRDMLARDKLRKEGAWTYELSKDLA